jgi:hypothetical protein
MSFRNDLFEGYPQTSALSASPMKAQGLQLECGTAGDEWDLCRHAAFPKDLRRERIDLGLNRNSAIAELRHDRICASIDPNGVRQPNVAG